MNAYHSILSILKECNIVYDCEFETLPFLYILADMTAFNFDKNREKIVKSIQSYIEPLSVYDAKEFNKRLDLYGKVIARQIEPRNECLIFGDINNQNYIVRALATFIDLITNPGCRNDYQTAPIMINDITNVMGLIPLIEEILNVSVSFCDVIYDLK